MQKSSKLLLLFLLLHQKIESRTTGYSTKDMLEAWQRYQEACIRKMMEDPQPTGLVCNRTFDMYVCWDDALPNTSAQVPCPWYLPWHQQVQDGFVFQKCGADGQWVIDASGLPWRDHSQCVGLNNDLPFQKHLWILEQFRLMYTVGYSVSLMALLVALALLAAFRKLRCKRNYIHMNLFLSYVLRAVSILVRDTLLWLHFPKDLQVDLSHLPREQAVAGCRLAQFLTQYCVCANYFWLLVEGLYLHNLLGQMAFSEETYFPAYVLLGWGAPVLFVIPWGIMRYLYENNECWERNDNMGYWWIIRCPILVSIFVNFVIFIRVIKILISKLRAQQMGYMDYKCRLAKSTLTLIPLLGTHEVAFALVTEEQAQGTLRYIKFFFELFLNSFQGLLVSTFYCFVNKEVQSEIQRKWQACQLDISLLEKAGRSFGLWGSWRSRKSETEKPTCAPIYSQAGQKASPGGLENAAVAPFKQTHMNCTSPWYVPIRMKAEK
ncbi:gastric inhibitory polypeptide receptor-like isoform X1 [Python bivittatus]|uniref:Gastric inhibitory polypeptide receptor-like isoform X1 n=2 Tax=Python bivittatus TaxID=176946 RepID=A0A9F5J5A4_PYTBI|nr:gastric inhibitory polypeptide receptor-like isoform X1 [Python bivittatus]XP_025027543.1 gastric inhibitory polypeptide receptor-like isoform X1 [Python bivittatus]XP_025027544.1 gastric inhibitory polypeptide receptor-like isoform X1 [Python bivittatus]